MKDFTDHYGNMLPNSYQVPKQSENPTTFNVAYFFSVEQNAPSEGDMCRESVFRRTKAKYITNGNTWRTMEHDDNPSWSLDEKISALAFFSYNGQDEWVDKIPLFPSFNNSSWESWLRPDVMAYTLIIKYPWTRRFLFWIVHAKIYRSIVDFDKDPAGESSGVQLAFIMLMGLKEFDLIKDGELTWKEAFDIYYPEPDHPIRKLWGPDEHL